MMKNRFMKFITICYYLMRLTLTYGLPDALVVQQRMERLLWERHLQQIRPCTCQNHCQQPEQLRPRHTS